MRFNRIYCTIFLIFYRLYPVVCHRSGPSRIIPTHSNSINTGNYVANHSAHHYGRAPPANYYNQPGSNKDYIIERTGSSLYPDTFVQNLPNNRNFNYGPQGPAPQQSYGAQPGPFHLVVLDISKKRNTASIIYEFDHQTRTHVFSAKPGYLIKSAVDEAEIVWEPPNFKYADKLTVKETPSGDFDIKVFVPIEATSDSEAEDHPPRPAYAPPTFAGPQYPPYPAPQQLPAQPRPQHAHNLVHIDIAQLFTTQEVDYFLDHRDGCHIFTPRPGFSVNLVTKGSELIWNYKGGDYPHQVVMCPGPYGKDKVQVLFPQPGAGYESAGRSPAPAAGNFRGAQPSAGPYREPYPSQPDPSRGRYAGSRRGSVQPYSPPEFITVDISNKSSTNCVVYEYDRSKNIHRFSCKPGYLVKKAIKGDRILRTFERNNAPNRLLVMLGPDNKSILRAIFPGSGEAAIPEPHQAFREPRPPKETPPLGPGEMMVTLTSVDVKNRQSTPKIEYKLQPNGSELFTCRPGFMLRKVKKGEKILWEYNQRVDLDYPNGVLVYTNKRGEKHLEILMPDEEPQFVTVDIRYKKSTDMVSYDYDKAKNRDLFTAKYPNLIYEVRQGNDLLWYSRDGRFPDKLLVIPVPGHKPILRVYYPAHQRPVPSEAAPMVKADSYKPELYQPTAAPVEPPDVPTAEAQPTPFPQPAAQPAEFGVEVSFKPEGKFVEGINTVALNVSRKKNTSEFTYSHVGHIGTYVPKDDHVFSSVSRDKEVIWTAEDHNHYANKVVMDGNGIFSSANNVTVCTLNDKFFHFRRDKNHHWVPVSPELELDIAHKDNLMQFVHTSHGDEQIYTTLHNFVFRSVREKERVIWEASGSSRSTRVVIKEVAQAKQLSIYLPEGILIFKKSKDGVWTELSSDIQLFN